MAIWRDCFAGWGGAFLFGDRPTVADAMYIPVVTRFLTYDVALDRDCAAFGQRIMARPAMAEWVAAGTREPEEPTGELEVEAELGGDFSFVCPASAALRGGRRSGAASQNRIVSAGT